MQVKSWWQSKTLWFSVLYGLVMIAGLFGFASFQPDAQVLEILGIVAAVVQIVLRYLTRQAIK